MVVKHYYSLKNKKWISNFLIPTQSTFFFFHLYNPHSFLIITIVTDNTSP